MRTAAAILFCSFFAAALHAEDEDLLKTWMESRPDKFQAVTDHAADYRLQIIYTRIERDARNHPTFQTFTYHVNPDAYFYPASFVKLPSAALVLEKARRVGPADILSARMTGRLDIVCPDAEKIVYRAPTDSHSLARLLKRMLLVSDNDAFNRVFDFVTPDFLNQRLEEMGYRARIFQRAGNCKAEENQLTNFLQITNARGRVLFQQNAIHVRSAYTNPLGDTPIGRAHYEDDKIVYAPQNFRDYNYVPLSEIHNMMISVIFPFNVPAVQRFRILPEDFAFLRRYLSLAPRESVDPGYSSRINDSFANYLLLGRKARRYPPGIKIFNVVARAYGFIGDSAYIIDTNRKVEFFLSAILYVNSDQVIGDDRYEYDTIGLPFLKELGQLVYDQEKTRSRAHPPDLSIFAGRE